MSITQQENRVHEPGNPTVDPRVAFFDHHAPSWDDDAEEVARTLARLRDLRSRIGLAAEQDVLEIGCGTGRITGWLVEVVRPGRVVAADFSPGMLARARTRSIDAEFRLLDICGDNVAIRRFDLVFCFNAFPHFRCPFSALRNIRSLLKPSGLLVILHLAGSVELNAFHSRLSHPVHHDHMPSPEHWPDMLNQSGMRLESLTDECGLFLLKAERSDGGNPAKLAAP